MRKEATFPLLFLRVYPKWWRERYSDEMQVMIQSLIERGRSPISLAVNLFASSASVWLRGTGAPPTREFWATRTQRSLLLSSLPWFVYFPLSVVFALSNSQSYIHGRAAFRRSGAGADALHCEIVLFAAVLGSCFVALVGWRILRNGLDGQNVRLTWFRLINRMAMVGTVLVIAALFLGQHDGTSSFAEPIAIVGGGLLAVAWLAMPGVIVFMMRDGRLDTHRLRAEARISIVMAMFNAVTTLCVAGYLFAISRQPPPIPGASYLFYRSTLGNWNAALLAAFAILSTLSAIGALTARQSYLRVCTLS